MSDLGRAGDLGRTGDLGRAGDLGRVSDPGRTGDLGRAGDPVDAAGPGGARRVPKPWGFELVWAETDRYVGKLLHVDAGRRLSLQRHLVKDETIFVLSGRLELHLEDDAGEVVVSVLGPGEHRHIAPGRIHRFVAVETAELMEVSTPELLDVVRLEDDFGREGTSAP